MNEANLTRFGPKIYVSEQANPSEHSATFRAIHGPAELVVQVDGVSDVLITMNGQRVVGQNAIGENSKLVVPLDLMTENTIQVALPAGSAGALGVRVTQLTRADLGLQRQGYFGLNTSDMERQRAFYKTLGFVGEIYPAGPETSTTFARSLGFADDYLIHVSLHSLEDPPTPPFVDTVQFRGDSFREEPPYARLNHIGMTYATYSTSDLEGDYSHLQVNGVEFVSPPATGPKR